MHLMLLTLSHFFLLNFCTVMLQHSHVLMQLLPSHAKLAQPPSGPQSDIGNLMPIPAVDSNVAGDMGCILAMRF